MKPKIAQARAQLATLLEQHTVTTGMSIRVHGDNLILGRPDPAAGTSRPQHDDRVRLTRLTASTFGLSVKRHTGRWERTPFAGKLDDMVDTIVSFMQHLVAPY